MDARVNDFLNEINEIAPLNETKSENVWERCLDEDSGYHYYWNVKTNEVTWDMPPEYKVSSKTTKSKKSCNLYIPPRTAPLFPSTSNIPPVSEAIKIYKIGEECTDANSNKKAAKSEDIDKVDQKQIEEKVVLISSYGDSESEDEQIIEKTNFKPQSPTISSNETSTVNNVPDLRSSKNEQSGMSLVACYSDSDESDKEEEKIAHSTLFPITKPISLKDFEESPKKSDDDFDCKAFQRKKRIGVALVNTGKKLKSDEENERKGLGFSNDNSNNSSDANIGQTYPGFKSGGVMFIKADVLNPDSSKEKEMEDAYKTLKEKLKFLSEGREEVSPVQVMLIQLETLYIALRSGDLKQTYLRKWLDETCSDLVKLEKDAAPEGWLLQWDRTHKRYYYQNASSGESQWEYPQTDVTRCDEAMDICTTPPPSEPTIQTVPPLPPIISNPSPPPPPTISDSKINNKKRNDIPLPPEPQESVDSNGEPLPPGVDSYETKGKTNDMTDVLNSFYSDIAAIETSNSPPVVNSEETKTESESIPEATKKKKKKVKLAQGLAMKKKGVSKLVEKWKNVQMSYND